ncbi:MAG: YlxR family protein [Chloroflexi bacterium]|nr:YlxR family protein [Chloroflexota bacterium]
MAQQQKGSKPRHVPQRTCIACRKVAGKRNLIRIVRTEQGVEVDPTGKKAGRGAYLHPNQTCWQAMLTGNRLAQALRTNVSPDNRRVLEAFMASLPVQEEIEDEQSGPLAQAST